MSEPIPSSSKSIPPIKIRKRAETRALLGTRYQGTVTKTVSPPKPEREYADYTDSRIVSGLEYADVTLRHPTRKLSPLGERAISLYKDACVGFLSLKENDSLDKDEIEDLKQDLVTQIRTYEQSNAFTGIMTTLNSSSAQELQDKILQLKRIEFYTRYGDLLAGPCKTLRVEAEAGKTEGWWLFSKEYWTSIDQTLMTEREAYQDVLRGLPKHQDCQTTLAVTAACRRIGVAEDDTMGIIHLYAERNRCIHSPLEDLILEAKFDSLKRQLYRDAYELPAVLPASETAYLNIVRHLLETLIDRWYTCFGDDPESWVPKDKLIKHHTDLKGDLAKKEKARLELKTAAEREIVKKLKEEQKQKRFMETAIEGGVIPNTETRKFKRVASSQLTAEKEKYQKQEKQYTTIMKVQGRATDLAEVYVAAFGPDPPEVPIVDPYE